MKHRAASARLIRLSLGGAVAATVSSAAFVAAALGASPAGSDPAAARTVAAPGNLYVVEAEWRRAVKTGDATWRLSLRDVSVLWFADRPARRSGFQGIAGFVEAWPATFRGAPPNAALLLPSRPAGARPITVELTKPRYHRSSGVASFELRPEAATARVVGAWLARLNRAEKMRTRRIVLFIDDGVSPLPSPDAPSPPTVIAEAMAAAEAAINTLKAMAVSSDPAVAAEANANLEQLAAEVASPPPPSAPAAGPPAPGAPA